MANKPMKRSWASLVASETQIKTQWATTALLLEWSQSFSKDKTAGQDGEQECKMAQPRWRITWQFLIKLNTHYQTTPNSHSDIIYPRDENLCSHKSLCVHVDSGFTHDHQELKFLSTGEWTNTPWQPPSQQRTLLVNTVTCNTAGRSQTGLTCSTSCDSRKDKTPATENRSMLPATGGE